MNKNQFTDTIHYHEVRQSFFILIVQILALHIVMALLDFSLGKLSIRFNVHDSYMHTWDFFLSNLLSIIFLLWIITQWISTSYIINSKEISTTTGIFHKKKSSYDIRGIQSCKTYQSIWGRIFNYGTIHLENPLLKSDIYMTNVSHPNEYAHLIENIRKKTLKEYPLTNVVTPYK